MTTHLREELTALADTQTFSPDPAAWDRGRRARRRDRVVRGAAAMAVVAVVAGSAVLVARPDPVGPADDPVRDGAIPSRIPEPDGPVVTDLAFGRASVAYVDDFVQPILVSATTGEARYVDLPDFPELVTRDMRRWMRGPWLALSPDGDRLAYPVGTAVERDHGVASLSIGFYRVVDLTTGETELVDLPPSSGMPLAMSWTADGQIAVDVFGRPTRRTSETNPPPTISWTIDPATGDSRSAPLTGVTAPGKGISAPFPTDDTAARAVPFETADGRDPGRRLPADLYPSGASVTPVGWADDSLLMAQVDGPAGSYVEGEHLVLMTSPDRPQSEWTYRILLRDVPETPSLSLAVDLVPDLDGTSSQVLTHDFGDTTAPDSGRTPVPYVLGALTALLSGLAFVRMMIKRA
jgi:hypothetical protein